MSTLFLVLALATYTSDRASGAPTVPPAERVTLRLAQPKPYAVDGPAPTFLLEVTNYTNKTIRVLNVAKYGYLVPHFFVDVRRGAERVPLGGAIADVPWSENLLLPIAPGTSRTLVGENRQATFSSLPPGTYRLSIEMLFGDSPIQEAHSNQVIFHVRPAAR
jgi:hypothetical protein